MTVIFHFHPITSSLKNQFNPELKSCFAHILYFSIYKMLIFCEYISKSKFLNSLTNYFFFQKWTIFCTQIKNKIVSGEIVLFAEQNSTYAKKHQYRSNLMCNTRTESSPKITSTIALFTWTRQHRVESALSKQGHHSRPG